MSIHFAADYSVFRIIMKSLKSLAVLAFGMISAAQAAVYRVDFSSSGYHHFGNPTVYADPSLGSLIFEDDPAQSGFADARLVSFNLTVKGRTYTESDVSLYDGTGLEIHGLASGENLAWGTGDDIILRFLGNSATSFTSGELAFVQIGKIPLNIATGFQFSVTAVPEADVVSMVGAGLLIAAVAASRRRKA